MSKIDLTDEDVKLLNSKVGLMSLLRRKKINLLKSLEEAEYAVAFKEKQEELIKLQKWVIENDQKIVILFEGRDAAGKGGAIRRVTEHINPRHFSIVALDIPTEDERKQWFFQRYINKLPKPGEIVLFDRSWYNRAVVEPVNEFCTEKEYTIFMRQVNDFEKMLVESDTHLIKLYFSITKEEQGRRFEDIRINPSKRWKLTEVDENSRNLWDEYTTYKKKMFERTDTEYAPWKIVDANNKPKARLEVINHILEKIPYKG